MGVYIPNLEMPASCVECRFHEDIFCNLTDICTNTAQRCPLVPVPPHGRLIDADALDDILADQSEDAYNRTHAPRSWERALLAMRDYLDDAPTIIPADKEGKG